MRCQGNVLFTACNLDFFLYHYLLTEPSIVSAPQPLDLKCTLFAFSLLGELLKACRTLVGFPVKQDNIKWPLWEVFLKLYIIFQILCLNLLFQFQSKFPPERVCKRFGGSNIYFVNRMTTPQMSLKKKKLTNIQKTLVMFFFFFSKVN